MKTVLPFSNVLPLLGALIIQVRTLFAVSVFDHIRRRGGDKTVWKAEWDFRREDFTLWTPLAFKTLLKHSSWCVCLCVSSGWWVTGAVKANSLCRSVMYCSLSRGNPEHSASRRSDWMRKLAAIITRALINISAVSAGISYSFSLFLSPSVWLLPLWIAEYIEYRKTLRK